MKIILAPTDDFDKALASNRDPGTVFVLTQGIYKTRGNWYFNDWLHLAPGCQLIGNGSILKLDISSSIKSFNGVVRPDRDLNILWVGANTLVENLTLDGCESELINVDPLKTWFVTTGLRSFGKLTANNVTVQNIRGTYSGAGTLSKQIEAFGISVTGFDGGSIIKDCIVQNCPENSYISAFLAGHVGSTAAKTTVSNCKINVGKTNWFGFGINSNALISNCEIINGPRIAIYNDTNTTENCVIENCKFNNVEKLISLIIPPGVSFPKKNVKIQGCNVGFLSGSTRHLIELWDRNPDATLTKRQLGPIYIQNTSIDMADPTTKLYVATVGSDIRPITIADCNIPVSLENMAGNMLSIF
jgi:hypothetical protein